MRQKTQKEEVTEYYRRVFNNKYGRKVLTHMLTELGFFNEIDKEDDLVRQNYAKSLLSHLGIYQAMNVEGIVDAFMNLPHDEVLNG